MKRLVVHVPGTVAYGEALAFQVACVGRLSKARGSAAPEGRLILLDHPAVITVGRGGSRENILSSAEVLRREGIEVFEASRGGDVTYHGPGQIVGYSIIRLDEHGADVHRYLRDLESVIISALADLGIASGRREGYTGVWVGRDKIAAIGVAITHWVTYHGFALNVAPNLGHFDLIRPCGIRDGGVTSMERLLDRRVDDAEVRRRLTARFCEVFGFDEVVEKKGPLALDVRRRAGTREPSHA